MLLKATQVSKHVASSLKPNQNQLNEPIAIVKNVDLELAESDSLAITGASGSGKSTLLGLLAGLNSTSEGEIELLGQSLHQLDEESKARLRLESVGFIFQSFQLIPTLTALQNVAIPMKLRAIDRHGANDSTKILEEATIILEKLGLGDRLHHRPAQLSGGEQQRVAIARAVICKPKILFADEPTGNLDRKRSEQICDWLFSTELWEGHIPGIILVTHDPAVAGRCQTQREMDNGNLLP